MLPNVAIEMSIETKELIEGAIGGFMVVRVTEGFQGYALDGRLGDDWELEHQVTDQPCDLHKDASLFYQTWKKKNSRS